MRELKFRYVCKDMLGRIFSFIKTIEEMERAELNINTHGRIQEIISRDQYTELKDKNGKEIYDGYWLKWNNNFFWVNWDDFNGCWYGEPHIDNVNIGILTAPSFKDGEISGNKFDNPKLMEATDK